MRQAAFRFSFLLVLCLFSACRESAPQPAGRGIAERREPKSASSVVPDFSLSHWDLVDLTHSFAKDTIYWPTARGFELKVDAFGFTDKGYFYAANSFAAAEHGGTHIDAPIHFHDQRATVDQIPLERLIGEAVVIDVREACRADPDYQICVNDLHAWEEKHGRQLIDVVVLLRTGFGEYWPDRKRYLGTDERGAEAVAKLHFPGLSPAAARWLVEHRDIKSIGIDTASIDYGQSTLFESHVLLFTKNVPVLENVANLTSLPEKGFQILALPMKIRGGSGGPTRVLALLPK